MAYTTIDDPEAYFQTVLWTGNGSARSITLGGDTDMQPDFVWIKRRNSARNHALLDSVRGGSKQLLSNSTAVEGTDVQLITAFDSDGFSLGTSNDCNSSSDTFVAWCWKAGTAFSNDASGTSIGNTDSSGSASSTAGFSICSYTGAGSSLDITVKHGLGVIPAVMITKNLEDANSWPVYHHKNTAAPETDFLELDTTDATADQGEVWLDTAPTSAIFTAGDFSGSNRSGDDFVGYFWNEVQGFSKFGSYTGNGDADGTFVYLGFRPAWLMIKKSSDTGNWLIWDSKREAYNVDNDALLANTDDAEETDDRVDLLSNGFKMRGSQTANNASGATYVFMAFAEAPFVNSEGVPCNAR